MPYLLGGTWWNYTFIIHRCAQHQVLHCDTLCIFVTTRLPNQCDPCTPAGRLFFKPRNCKGPIYMLAVAYKETATLRFVAFDSTIYLRHWEDPPNVGWFWRSITVSLDPWMHYALTLSDRILVSKHCTCKPREILKDRTTTWIHVLSPTILRKSLGLSKHYVLTSNITASRGKVQLAFRRNDAMGLLAPSRQYEKTGGHSPRFAMVWICLNILQP